MTRRPWALYPLAAKAFQRKWRLIAIRSPSTTTPRDRRRVRAGPAGRCARRHQCPCPRRRCHLTENCPDPTAPIPRNPAPPPSECKPPAPRRQSKQQPADNAQEAHCPDRARIPLPQGPTRAHPVRADPAGAGSRKAAEPATNAMAGLPTMIRRAGGWRTGRGARSRSARRGCAARRPHRDLSTSGRTARRRNARRARPARRASSKREAPRRGSHPTPTYAGSRVSA